jgi:SAM-dependent methyltransferase
MAVYDTIGTAYTATRRPDPRIGAQIAAALSGCQSVINVGAGAGAYEPPQTILAVDPSLVMTRQRPPGAAPAVLARAEALPVTDGAADAAMAVLTVHHWDDLEAGISELRRVARRRVTILTWDSRATEQFWLLSEYLPEAAAFDSTRSAGRPPYRPARRSAHHTRPRAPRLHRRLCRRVLAPPPRVPRPQGSGGHIAAGAARRGSTPARIAAPRGGPRLWQLA